MVRPQPRQHLGRRRHQRVAADNQVGLAQRHAGGVQVLRPVGQLHMAEHGAALLRQARHVQHGDALAFDVGGRAQ
ncbi:hypothetical protein G6F55_014491 [Rhizopus delemar]|nr:hypothetical protein G6F22_019856 [Rhizopus arrhizus]KAG1434691.1 hypothetical protein G6F55_014491 [Rhizopus delemar]